MPTPSPSLESVELRIDEQRKQAAERDQKRIKQPDLPVIEPWTSGSPSGVRAVAVLLSDALGESVHLTDEQVRKVGTDNARPIVDKLLPLDEFATVADCIIDLVFTRRAIIQRDVVLDSVIAGKVNVPSKEQRDTGKAGDFRLLVSLPWWLLADEDERTRALHGLLCRCAWVNGQPKLRKPDAVLYRENVGRFGAQGVREVGAVAHAMRHPSLPAALLTFGFDPVSGQGLLYGPAEKEAKKPAARADRKSQAAGREE